MPFRSRYIVALLLLLLQVPGGVSGTPTPNRNCPTTTRANRNHVFGRPISSLATTPAPRRAPGFAPARLVQLRGGELHHPETLDDVEAIISKAASEQKLVVIDFTASWCGPCKAIAPLFKELSEEITDVVFVKVDVDENPDTAAKYSVSAMPTFVFIKGGEVVDRLMGASPEHLQKLIRDNA